jgi:glucuronate isomerase
MWAVDSIGDWPQAEPLSRFLDRLDTENAAAPQTVLYNVNPAANYVFGTMAGNFPDGTTRARCSSAPAGGLWTRRKAWSGRSTP